MKTLDMEQSIFQIIAHGGNAKGLAFEGLEKAHLYRFSEAEELLKEAHSELNLAHNTQTQLIQAELNGEKVEGTLLMIHAQDHLMAAISEISLIEQMVKMLKKMELLEKK
ncbi:PTS lactose/cellobiose transporter subunit IIA [Heyndrickxia acidicola]|jgi:PTS system cellobiose-specific IIA component|uniref:PTS lactose/cellobiose transporter subunit IIA n=1 Tax=Heyndrickxia acidicola TaxID=209389 RepID=A0ABU6MEB2_9BACI|nr:PTS lactose/cellobiose transporter subunit IIA [Heyndrickxia acidicola]MED1202779.1 PTS lactose/cellobiose transporter subunit IIA [Heyndrickxia acidicola]